MKRFIVFYILFFMQNSVCFALEKAKESELSIVIEKFFIALCFALLSGIVVYDILTIIKSLFSNFKNALNKNKLKKEEEKQNQNFDIALINLIDRIKDID